MINYVLETCRKNVHMGSRLSTNGDAESLKAPLYDGQRTHPGSLHCSYGLTIEVSEITMRRHFGPGFFQESSSPLKTYSAATHQFVIKCHIDQAMLR